MRKALVLLLLLCLSLGLPACETGRPGTTMTSQVWSASSTISAAPARPADFSLRLQYGAGLHKEGMDVKGKYNELDTAVGTFTKDMISAPPLTVPLALSPAELDGIYSKMVEIDFFGYPGEFAIGLPPNATTIARTPSDKYYFKVTSGGQVKTLFWDDYIMNPDAQASRLRELIRLIKGIIESKDSYRALPPASGGYE